MAKKKATKKKTVKKKTTKKKRTKKKSTSTKTETKQTAQKTLRRPKSVQSALSSLARQVNKNSQEKYGYTAAGEYYSDVDDWISTGCTPLDVTLWGGWPRGRVVAIQGDPSQGKSTLMESTLAQNDKVGGANVLLMSESCLDASRMRRQGVNLENLLPLEIDTLDQGVFYMRDALLQRETFDPAWCKAHPLVIAWDTPSNAQEQHIFDDPEAMFDAGMASKARAVRAALRTIVPLAGRLNVTILLLFQQHQKIGTPYSGKDVDCGGGPKFNASLRIKAWQAERIYNPNMTDREIGIVSGFELIKSKAGCPPFRQAEAVIRALDGIDNDASMFRFLRESWCVDPCPTCGGRKAVEKKGVRQWESDAWKSCEACNQSGEVYHLIDHNDKQGAVPTRLCVVGKNSSGNATQWRYIFGWPGEEKICTTDAELSKALDERPGLRTWLAEQCWRRCTKPTPPKTHPVE